MRADDAFTCAFCPRLCRHRCPVAVATAREAAVPTAMMTAVWRALTGEIDRAAALEATRYCLGCDACTAHCKHHLPVADLLAEFRGEARPAPSPAPAGASFPAAELRFVTCREGPGDGPDQLACCGRRDGFDQREPALAREVAEANVRRFAGRSVACADPACAAWLRAHGARIVADGGEG